MKNSVFLLLFFNIACQFQKSDDTDYQIRAFNINQIITVEEFEATTGQKAPYSNGEIIYYQIDIHNLEYDSMELRTYLDTTLISPSTNSSYDCDNNCMGSMGILEGFGLQQNKVKLYKNDSIHLFFPAPIDTTMELHKFDFNYKANNQERNSDVYFKLNSDLNITQLDSIDCKVSCL